MCIYLNVYVFTKICTLYYYNCITSYNNSKIRPIMYSLFSSVCILSIKSET